MEKGIISNIVSKAWHDAEKVVFLSLNDLAKHSRLSFLATLMFAPVASVVEVASVQCTPSD
eukprot:983673-Amphidinium_carterae.1